MNTTPITAPNGSISVKLVLRVAFVIAAVLAFISLNSSLRSDRTPLQNDFDSWLQSTKQAIASASPTTPPLSVALKSDRVDFKANWKIAFEAGGNPERIVRLLDLANAANVFSRGLSNDPNLMQLTVSDGVKEFAAALSPKDIAENVAAGNLVRLFQIYAVEMPESGEPEGAQ